MLVYPEKDQEMSLQKIQSTLCKVQEYFHKTFPDIEVEMPDIPFDDNVMRNISLSNHLLKYQRIIANRNFTIHSSTVAQISNIIVSIYTHIYERHVQLVYPASLKREITNNHLEEAKQV